jgi:hypothetical protein
MSVPSSTPSLVPNYDFAVYIALDDFGKAGLTYREARTEDATLATVIADIVSGQYNDPRQIIAFNAAEGWSRDVTEDVARNILDMSVRENIELRGPARAFVERETGSALPVN